MCLSLAPFVIPPSLPSLSSLPPSLPQLEDFIPEVEEFYKRKHNGRKLYWHHIMSNGVVRANT